MHILKTHTLGLMLNIIHDSFIPVQEIIRYRRNPDLGIQLFRNRGGKAKNPIYGNIRHAGAVRQTKKSNRRRTHLKSLRKRG